MFWSAPCLVVFGATTARAGRARDLHNNTVSQHNIDVIHGDMRIEGPLLRSFSKVCSCMDGRKVCT